MSTIDSTKVLQEFKCPNCAGKVEFDSKDQVMKCPYCESEFDVNAMSDDENLAKQDEVNPEWEKYDENSGSGDWKDGEKEQVRRYICQFCAGEIMTNSETAATKCPYCDNPVVILDRVDGAFRPDLVIPFMLDKNDAMAKFTEFFTGKKLLPDCFKDKNHIEELTGIYVPFWLYDCTAAGKINFNATKIRHWSDSRYSYTKTSHYAVLRDGEMGFVKVPADGSKKMDDTLMEAIEPYDYSKAVDFQTAYLSGYLAEKYDVEPSENQARINQRITESLIAEMKKTITGYTSCAPAHKNIVANDAKINYALLPVWILNTEYKGEKFTYAMNGQTGKFVGRLPIDKAKGVKYFAGICAACTAIFTVISLFL
ncbi:MAG: hypothetical protein R3Y09_00025 [Clostridia bacterium]